MASIDAPTTFALLSGLAYVTFAVAVLRVRPRLPRNAFLASYLLGYGANYLVGAWQQIFGSFEARTTLLILPIVLVADAAGLGLAMALPRASAVSPRRLAAFVGAGLAAAMLLSPTVWYMDYYFEAGPLFQAAGVVFLFDYAVFYAALAVLLWKISPRRLDHVGDATPLAVLVFVLLSVVIHGSGFAVGATAHAFQAGRYLDASEFLFSTLVPVIPGLALVFRSRAFPGQSGRAVMVVGLLCLLIPAAMAIRAIWSTQTTSVESLLSHGLLQFFALGLLGYLVLRHQLLGLDIKVRLAIKGSTITAAFVGVFFMVSEVAQAFFGERLQSEYLGIAAAGGLVFMLAPLQRLADRVANAAIPRTSTDATQAEDAYRNALAIALRDRKLSSQEEAHLAELADTLGLKPSQALRIRTEVGEGRGGPGGDASTRVLTHRQAAPAPSPRAGRPPRR